MKSTQLTNLVLRKPTKSDGTAMWHLAQETKSLDLNSVYAYLMMSDMFSDTCAVALEEEKMVGFITGFLQPERANTLFIWQIGVKPGYRKRGIAKQMLLELLKRDENRQVRFLEATVGPNNLASRELFLRLAAELKTECKISEHFSQRLFPTSTGHEAELLFRMGPFKTKEVVE
ncbi:diaminobutyrate acetyltransferase [Paenibacillus silvisoli]|uniref:diaminobutyrate acetyltransferase n=1 Tax=Paenibacillus silvisoli TaxID=3110539 RepID=UPI002B1BE272|nr:diaminobutyrate acetyltransferase [Paenibacillus silvisoli]